MKLFIRPAFSDLTPFGKSSLGGRLPNFFQFFYREIIYPVILRIYNNCKSVICYRKSQVVNATLFRFFNLTGFYLAGGVININISANKFLESAAGTGYAYGYPYIRGFGSKFFSNSF